MDEPLEPTIGSWYKDLDGRSFEVVAVDEEAGTVEVQYFDGTLGELELEAWQESRPEPIEPPEDWTGAYEPLDRDDRGESDAPMRPEDWNGPWDELDRAD